MHLLILIGFQYIWFLVILFRQIYDKLSFNPFVANAPFLYPLETSENRKVF